LVTKARFEHRRARSEQGKRFVLYLLNAGSGWSFVALTVAKLSLRPDKLTGGEEGTQMIGSTVLQQTIAVALGATLAGSLAAAPVQVQFKQSAGANDQAGWTILATNAPPVQGAITGGEFDGLTYTANGTHLRSHTHHADYQLVDHTDGDLDNLLSGGLLSNDEARDITLTLSGLADGNYVIATYHHTPYRRTDGFNFDLRLTDAIVTDSTVYDDVPVSFGAAVSTATLASLVTLFTVDGGSTVTLVFDPEAAGMASLGGDHLNLNGFELAVAVPDNTPPEIATLRPVNGATGVGIGADLAVTFDEIVQRGTGDIVIRRTGDDSVVETIDVAGAAVTLNGRIMTVDPTGNLAFATGYYVQIATNAIADASDNHFAGITNTATWSFSTRASEDASLLVHYTFDADAGIMAIDQASVNGEDNLTLTGASVFTTDPERDTVLDNRQSAILSPFTSTSQNYTFAGWYKGTGRGYWYDQNDRLIFSVENNTQQDPADGGAAAGLGVYDGLWHNSSTTNANDGSWHHLACVWETDGLGPGMDSFSIYLDGVARDVNPATNGVQVRRALTNGVKTLGGTQKLFSANTGSGAELAGLMDGIRIYDRVLDATQVAALFAAERHTWSDFGVSNSTGDAVWPHATAATNVTDAVLVWDTSDKLSSDIGDWTYARRLGARSAGAIVSGQATNLQPDTVYAWRLFAGGVSNGWSGPLAFATALTAAQAPVFTNATVSGVAIELGWQDKAATETSYILRRSESPGGPYAVIANLGTDTTSYADVGLSIATTYYYQLAATNSGNRSATEFAACQTSATTERVPVDIVATLANDVTLGGYIVEEFGTIQTNGSDRTVGTSNSGALWDTVYTIKLPDLVGGVVDTAAFSFDIGSENGAVPDVKLVALRVSSINTITASDHQAAGTLLVDTILTAADNGPGDTVTTGTDVAALNEWLAANYLAGHYAVIALQPQTNPGGSAQRWMIRDRSTGTPARLTLHSVPETVGTVLLVR
jgi:hypothetical protein